MEVKLRTLFFLYRSKVNSKGEAPLYCRITLDKRRRHFSTGFFIKPVDWNSTKQAIKSSNPISSEINNHLTTIKQKILKASIQLETNENEITVDSVISLVRGKKVKMTGFLEAFRHHNRREKSLIGKTYTGRYC